MLKTVFTCDPSKLKSYRFQKTIWVWKVILPTITFMTLGFYLLGNQSTFKPVLIIFAILFISCLIVTTIVYFIGYNDEHKIITLNEDGVSSEFSDSNMLWADPLYFEIKYDDIDFIKVGKLGFTVYKKGRKKKLSLNTYESTDKYLKLINVPVVIENYDELLRYLRSKIKA